MSQKVDYPTELKKILWERLKSKNESFVKFERVYAYIKEYY